jgi:hypothetical protein
MYVGGSVFEAHGQIREKSLSGYQPTVSRARTK